MNHDHFIVPPGKKIKLKDYDPGYTAGFKDKAEATEELAKDVLRLAKYQDMLYAQNTHALLVILQAMDAAGKDGAIRYVMSGINPQGTQVYSFKGPSAEELDHDFLWRNFKALPERGRIGIFNRSYYEETLIVRVHPEILDSQQLPTEVKGKNIWKQRFQDINNFERYLVRNGIHVLKFFLNVSKAEQKRRFLKRINTPEKNWKFSLGDARERSFWDDYMEAFQDAFNHTSTSWAPWHIIPADHKWFTRAAIADVIISKLKSLDLAYPTLSPEHLEQLQQAKELLESEPE
ncbi:MAG: polyphosphate kinase 2 family protein [Acidobacteria bacterium]|nr:polyphosphate kinase 2 family protein [Acidobacteriota bacterium]